MKPFNLSHAYRLGVYLMPALSLILLYPGNLLAIDFKNIATGNAYSLALGDLDNEGDVDAFIGWADDSDNRVYLNDGSDSFDNSDQELGEKTIVHVVLVDVDGDGDIDLLIGRDNDPNLVLFNDGTGLFSDSGQTLGGDQTQSIALADLDGDGDLDIFEGSYEDYNKVWLNDGHGYFFNTGQEMEDRRTYIVALGDTDGDGDIDAVIGNYKQRNYVWTNNGRGTYVEDDDAQSGSNTTSLAWLLTLALLIGVRRGCFAPMIII